MLEPLDHCRRETIAEGTFASPDRLSWAQSRLRGLWKAVGDGYRAALAHNVLKMVRRLGHGVGPLGQPSAALDVSGGLESTRPVRYRIPPLHQCHHGASWVQSGSVKTSVSHSVRTVGTGPTFSTPPFPVIDTRAPYRPKLLFKVVGTNTRITPSGVS